MRNDSVETPRPSGDTTHLETSWSVFYDFQRQARRQYPTVWKIPFLKRRLDVYRTLDPRPRSVLDVGAHDRRLADKLSAMIPGTRCKTMDVDPVGDHDYTSTSEIQERFDAVHLSEVIEHLSFTEGVHLLREIFRILNPGGYIVASTPNTAHPHRFWTSPDHVTAYHYDALGGLLLGTGFTGLRLYRVHREPWLQMHLRRWVTGWIHQYLSVDFADTILAVARKDLNE